MPFAIGHRVCVVMTSLLLTAAASAQPDEPARLQRIDGWQSVLPGATVRPRIRIAAGDPPAVRLAWELTARHRTIRRGDQRLPGGQAPQEVAIELAIPQLNDQISLDVELSVWLEDAGGKRIDEALQQTLWIRAADPWGDARQRLEEQKIVLFDPEKTTVARFEAARIPFRLARSIDAVTASDEGLVVIGEGISFDTNRGLAAALRTLVGHGRRVLVLAPSAGAIAWSEEANADNPPGFRSLRLRQRDIISEFDKRLDAAAWLDIELSDGRLGVNLGGGGLSVEVAGNQFRWSYVELAIDEPPGRIVICDLPIIRHWEAGPTPRYLLAHLLTHLDPGNP